jgi:eukaryotic-like serine/threonine-protein kinase
MNQENVWGIRVKGYDVLYELAHGSFGSVYLGVQQRLKCFVAIKVLAKELSDDKLFIRQFYHEAKVAAQLTHPNVIKAYDVGQAESGHYYFAMEHIDGEDLSRKMRRLGRIPWRQAMVWMQDVASALDYGMHKHGLTHGDIKPANVMISREGKVKLADLGLAYLRGDTRELEQLFTPYYASPEVIDNSWKVGDAGADMYSFGATLYHMIAGVPVFDSADCAEVVAMHRDREPIDCHVFVNLPDDVSDFICRLLEKEPERRFLEWSGVVDVMAEMLGEKTMTKTHSGAHRSRKKSVDWELREKALERLKKRKKRKIKIIQRYCVIVLGIAFLLVLLSYALPEESIVYFSF